MSDPLIHNMKTDRAAGMPDYGGWFWGGNRDSLALQTYRGGRQTVMDFVRFGFNSAQPRFQSDGLMRGAITGLTKYVVGDIDVRGHADAIKNPTVYRLDICGIDHPDARRIARVPEMEARILSDAEIIDGLKAENARFRLALAAIEARK